MSQPLEYSGWLHKWTNYIHGYQKRFFRLKGEHLCYYRSDSESAPCRGKLRVDKCTFHVQSSTMFTIASENQNYTLRASNEIQRQHWITSIELARTQIKQKRKRNSLNRKASNNSTSTNKHQNYYNISSQATVTSSSLSKNVKFQDSNSVNSQSLASTSKKSLQSKQHLLDNTSILSSGLESETENLNDLLKESSSRGSTSSLDSGNESNSKDLCSHSNSAATKSIDHVKLKRILKQMKKHKNNSITFLALADAFIKNAIKVEKEMNSVMLEERSKRITLEKQIEVLAQQHLNLDSDLKKAQQAEKNLQKNRQKSESIKINNSSNNQQHLQSQSSKPRSNTTQTQASSQSSKTVLASDEDEFEDALSDGFEINDDDVKLLDFQENVSSKDSASVGSLEAVNTATIQESSQLSATTDTQPTDASANTDQILTPASNKNSIDNLEPPFTHQTIELANKSRRTTILPRSQSSVKVDFWIASL